MDHWFKSDLEQILMWEILSVLLPKAIGFLEALWFPPPSINWLPPCKWKNLELGVNNSILNHGLLFECFMFLIFLTPTDHRYYHNINIPEYWYFDWLSWFYIFCIYVLLKDKNKSLVKLSVAILRLQFFRI